MTYYFGTFRDARRHRHLTQLEVAALTGLSQSVVSDLETGKNTNPTWDVLSKLSQVYHRRPEDLLPHVPLPGVKASPKRAAAEVLGA